MMKQFFAIALLASLCACGGGGAGVAPLATQLTVSNLQYGKTAAITLQGRYFGSGMTAQTGSCSNPSFNESSTPEVAVLNCNVTAIGDIPIVIKDARGQEVFATTLTVPKPQVTLITSKGNIVMELNPEVVPITVNNFLAYVASGYYRSTLFHRVISGFVVQGGGYTTGMVKKPGQLAAIALETNKGLLNTKGSVAMARTSVPDSATSEFFINLVDNPALNFESAAKPGYAVFGTVVQGMDVVSTMAIVQTGTSNGFADVPAEDVTVLFAIQSR